MFRFLCKVIACGVVAKIVETADPEMKFGQNLMWLMIGSTFYSIEATREEMRILRMSQDVTPKKN